MAHVRKGVLVASPEWWKHLRPYNKRKFWKAQRKAQAAEVRREMVR